MAVSCDANSLLQAASGLQRIPAGMQGPVMIYLLQQISGNTQTPQELADSARCYANCIPDGMVKFVLAYLLCSAVNKL